MQYQHDYAYSRTNQQPPQIQGYSNGNGVTTYQSYVEDSQLNDHEEAVTTQSLVPEDPDSIPFDANDYYSHSGRRAAMEEEQDSEAIETGAGGGGGGASQSFLETQPVETQLQATQEVSSGQPAREFSD